MPGTEGAKHGRPVQRMGDLTQAVTAKRRIVGVWAVGDVHCGATGEAGVDFYESKTASGKWWRMRYGTFAGGEMYVGKAEG